MNEKNNDQIENKTEADPLAGVQGFPDVFDDMDCRPENSYPEANSDAVTPDYIKKMLAGEGKGADNADAADKE